jgi:hypothetical protein
MWGEKLKIYLGKISLPRDAWVNHWFEVIAFY